MGRIDISYHEVRQKSEKLTKQIQNKLEGNIIERYDKIKGNMLQSEGVAINAVLEEVEQEKEALMEMKNLMLNVLVLLQESTDAFEEVDATYDAAAKNLGKEI